MGAAAGQRPADLRAASACCCWQEGRDSCWPGMRLGARGDAARPLGRHRRYRPARQPACVHGGATGTRSAPHAGPKGETMIRSVTRLTALSRHRRMLLALPAAVLGVTLAACGGGSAAHPAAPKPTSAAPSHSHSAPPSVPVTTPPPATTPPAPAPPRLPRARHRPGPYRQSDPAGQRRRPGRRQQRRTERWRREHLANGSRPPRRQPRSGSDAGPPARRGRRGEQ